MIRALRQGTPDNEQKAVVSAYPVFSWLLTTLLRLSAKNAQASLDRIRAVFEAVDARLASGARFLVGDRLTLSDLAFSMAAAPVLLPPSYDGPMPSFNDIPSEIRATVNEMRSHASGTFALRIYEDQRGTFGTQTK